MTRFSSHDAPWEIFSKGGELRANLSGPLDVWRSGSLLHQIRRQIHSMKQPRVILDLQNVTRVDDAGVIVLTEIQKLVASKGGMFHWENITPEQKGLMEKSLAATLSAGPARPSGKNANPMVAMGEMVFSALANIKNAMVFTGGLMLSFWRILIRPSGLRFGDTLVAMKKTGVDAVPIVALISFLLGLIMAFMSSIQLRQFGANIYVASLVTLAMVSELGPIMTAIVVAGRSGSAFAAEIATMKISEEIDALYVMGFDTVGFLAIPKVAAAALVMPVLTLFSDLFAIAGGMVVGVFLLDITPGAYMDQTIKSLDLFEFGWGLSKSLVFALLISTVGCFRGFRARGGADSVGDAATSAVVTSIFLIILFDSVFAVGRSFWK